MAYYNRKYQEIKLNNMEYLSSGGCAQVFYDKDKVFKEYSSKTTLNWRLSEKMFDILKDIDNPNFIELFDIYSDCNRIGLFKNRIKDKPFIVDAYTAKYYPGNNLVNVMFEQKDYLLENIKNLENLFETFSDYRICAEDVKKRNTIINRNGIVIIDPDLFYMFNKDTSKDFRTLINKRRLLELLRSIMINSEPGEVDYQTFNNGIDMEILDFKVTEKTSISNEVAKKLKYVKRPINLFNKTTESKGN